MTLCKTIGCTAVVPQGTDFCPTCEGLIEGSIVDNSDDFPRTDMVPLGELTEIDVFGVHHLFQMDDPSGCLQAASARLLMCGFVTDYQRMRDVKHARYLLDRWIELNSN